MKFTTTVVGFLVGAFLSLFEKALSSSWIDFGTSVASTFYWTKVSSVRNDFSRGLVFLSVPKIIDASNEFNDRRLIFRLRNIVHEGKVEFEIKAFLSNYTSCSKRATIPNISPSVTVMWMVVESGKFNIPNVDLVADMATVHHEQTQVLWPFEFWKGCAHFSKRNERDAFPGSILTIQTYNNKNQNIFVQMKSNWFATDSNGCAEGWRMGYLELRGEDPQQHSTNIILDEKVGYLLFKSSYNNVKCKEGLNLDFGSISASHVAKPFVVDSHAGLNAGVFATILTDYGDSSIIEPKLTTSYLGLYLHSEQCDGRGSHLSHSLQQETISYIITSTSPVNGKTTCFEHGFYKDPVYTSHNSFPIAVITKKEDERHPPKVVNEPHGPGLLPPPEKPFILPGPPPKDPPNIRKQTPLFGGPSQSPTRKFGMGSHPHQKLDVAYRYSNIAGTDNSDSSFLSTDSTNKNAVFAAKGNGNHNNNNNSAPGESDGAGSGSGNDPGGDPDNGGSTGDGGESGPGGDGSNTGGGGNGPEGPDANPSLTNHTTSDPNAHHNGVSSSWPPSMTTTLSPAPHPSNPSLPTTPPSSDPGNLPSGGSAPLPTGVISPSSSLYPSTSMPSQPSSLYSSSPTTATVFTGGAGSSRPSAPPSTPSTLFPSNVPSAVATPSLSLAPANTPSSLGTTTTSSPTKTSGATQSPTPSLQSNPTSSIFSPTSGSSSPSPSDWPSSSGPGTGTATTNPPQLSMISASQPTIRPSPSTTLVLESVSTQPTRSPYFSRTPTPTPSVAPSAPPSLAPVPPTRIPSIDPTVFSTASGTNSSSETNPASNKNTKVTVNTRVSNNGYVLIGFLGILVTLGALGIFIIYRRTDPEIIVKEMVDMDSSVASADFLLPSTSGLFLQDPPSVHNQRVKELAEDNSWLTPEML